MTSRTQVLIASVTGFTVVGEWRKYPEQESKPITLNTGQRYYLESAQAGGGGISSRSCGACRTDDRDAHPRNRLSPWIRVRMKVRRPPPHAHHATTPTTAPTTPTTTTPTKSGYRLWKGINLGGEVVTIEGKAWLSQRQAEAMA